MKKIPGAKVIGYSLLLALGLIISMPNTDPQSNIQKLVAKAEAIPSRNRFQDNSATLIVQDWGYVLAIYVKDTPSCAPYQFLIISKIKGQLYVEGISGPGESNASRLSTEDAAAMIRKLDIPIDRLNLL